MAKLVKPWNDGGSLSATYNGSGDGEAIFSSDSYEGIDREMPITFRAGNAEVQRVVKQDGQRQRFVTSDNKVFCVTEGRFGVLRSEFAPEEPEEPIVETYTRLTYLQSTGVQHIELDYQLKETDAISVLYEPMLIQGSDQFLFGAPNTWYSTYNKTGYARFGHTESQSISNGPWYLRLYLRKEAIDMNGQSSTKLDYTGLKEGNIALFSGIGSTGVAYNRGNFRMLWFRIIDANGDYVVNLTPAKRDSDGKVGMLDLVSGKFYSNVDDGEDFLYGNELLITDEYELIDNVAFNNDKAFDTGFYGNEQTYIDVLFQRTDTSGADYLFGSNSDSRLTAYLTTSGYWRYGNAYPTFNTTNKNVIKASITPTKTSVNDSSKTFSTTAFTTSQMLPVGGSRGTSSTITKTYQGVMYYFRMWHGDTLLVDWYPCKRLSDGVVGFWDCVTQTFIEPIV